MNTLIERKQIRDTLKLLALCISYGWPMAAAAGPITWGSATTIAGDSDVFTTGTFKYAYHWKTGNTTVNGVTFTGTASTTAGGTDVDLSGFTANHTDFTSTSNPFASLSTAYKAMLAGSNYNGTATVTVTLKNLTVGNSYAVQAWVTDARSFGSGRFATFTSPGGNSVALDYNSTNAVGGVGQYSLGTFNANATTQTFTIVAGSSSQLNALQVRELGVGGPEAMILTFGPGATIGPVAANTGAISMTVPYGTNLATFAPTFTITSGSCNQTSGSPPSPTFAAANPATYTVTNGATINNYNVTINVVPPLTACDILTFNLLGNPGVIDNVAQTITVSVPVGTDVTNLAPTYTVSTSATATPTSGTTRDFTNPQTYTVTAQDGTTQKTYTVTVSSYESWTHSGSFYILTDATGANLPPSASESNFPLLVRFNSSNFPFAQAASDGSDIRFSTPSGVVLPYEIEQWDSVNGTAAVWVKIPTITGNARQEIKMFWGKVGVSSESNSTAVFNSSNGYCAVMHMNGNVSDATGSISPVNGGATPATGVIGNTAMNLSTGDITAANITNFPSGSNPTGSGQIWLRPRNVANWSMPLGWGNKNAYGWSTWQMQIGFWRSPTVLPTYLNCYGPAEIRSAANLDANQWYHLVLTRSGNTSRLYVNGVLDATVTSGGTLTSTNPQALALGMSGGDADVDEARISSVARSADWVKMEYENQKPFQTLVGGIVPTGSAFTVSSTSVTMNENSATTLTAQAGGAQKTYWIYKKDGQETVLATDQFTLDYSVGRITGNQSATIQFKAVFPGGVQTIDVPLTVLDSIPDPAFTLTPSTTTWDGRQTMTVTANVTNLVAMQNAGFANLTYNWSVNGVATAHSANNNILTLTRSQGSGPMTVTLSIDNGGTPVTQSTFITVQEPASDPWLARTPADDEKPVNGQFFARNPETNQGTIFYNGTQTGSPDTVYLKVYKTPSGGSETLDATHRHALVGEAYAISAPISAGLITYRVVYGTTTGGVDTDVAIVTDLVCGDAYLIEGQSNALAIDGKPDDLTTDPFIRTYSRGTPAWGLATRRGNNFLIGYWGMPLALHLKSTYNMPICMINAAVGGTRIDQHMPNPTNHSLPLGPGANQNIYANLYNRLVNARLTHGIRGAFWHQGENNSGSDAPTDGWDYKFYQNDFLEMTSAWKQDFPNIQKYIIFQVQPRPCSMGPKGDQLREVQRTLPRLFSNMSILSTIGIDSALGHDGCHYTIAGYQNIANLVAPVVERDFYNVVPSASVTAPNLKRAYYTNATRNQIALEFDQPTQWNSLSIPLFYLDDVAANISSGSHAGNVVTLQLAGASTSTTIDYVQDQTSTWDGNAINLITGANTIAALTFADVAIGPAPPDGLSAIGGIGQISLTWSATTGSTSYKVKRSTNSGGPYTTIASTTSPAFNDLTVVAGTPYYYVVSAVNTVGTSSSEGLDSTQATATATSYYATWANSAPFDGDSNNDGVKNGMAWVLGSTDPTVNANARLPALEQDGVQWVFEYNRNDDSLPPNTTQIVQYGDDLLEWTDITIPANTSGAVTITPGTPADHVRVVIPNIGEKMFARLKVTE